LDDGESIGVRVLGCGIVIPPPGSTAFEYNPKPGFTLQSGEGAAPKSDDGAGDPLGDDKDDWLPGRSAKFGGIAGSTGDVSCDTAGRGLQEWDGGQDTAACMEHLQGLRIG